MKTLLGVLPLLAVLFVSSLNAQTDEPETVSLPDHVMEQIVRRIVIAHFSSEKSSREIFFAERNIRPEWLPKLRGVRFTVVSDTEINKLGKDVHFFKQPTRVDDRYEIDFGWGDPDCSAVGETWSFRIVGDSVRVERTSAGWGMGCGSGS